MLADKIRFYVIFGALILLVLLCLIVQKLEQRMVVVEQAKENGLVVFTAYTYCEDQGLEPILYTLSDVTSKWRFQCGTERVVYMDDFEVYNSGYEHSPLLNYINTYEVEQHEQRAEQGYLPSNDVYGGF